MSERICIVPARGGSRGLPGKNLMRVGAETLVRSALRKGIESEAFDLIVLSSDDSAILAEGRFGNVVCHKRSAATSSGTATSESALLEVLEDLSISAGVIAMIQCTTPLLTATDIATCMKLHKKFPHGTIVSGYAVNMHHWFLKANGRLEPVGDSGELRQPRQGTSDRLFVENGGIYVTDVAAFLASGNRFNGQVIPYLMEEARSIDIDTEIDLQRLRLVVDR